MIDYVHSGGQPFPILFAGANCGKIPVVDGYARPDLKGNLGQWPPIGTRGDNYIGQWIDRTSICKSDKISECAVPYIGSVYLPDHMQSEFHGRKDVKVYDHKLGGSTGHGSAYAIDGLEGKTFNKTDPYVSRDTGDRVSHVSRDTSICVSCGTGDCQS